ncbi:hypothetical protein BX666DRAFT_1937549 [Dichotomocladium elegans]|nr:hypothetical protein BX666DRAFT_1937549 [Dichotomocladium elegans]
MVPRYMKTNSFSQVLLCGVIRSLYIVAVRCGLARDRDPCGTMVVRSRVTRHCSYCYTRSRDSRVKANWCVCPLLFMAGASPCVVGEMLQPHQGTMGKAEREIGEGEGEGVERGVGKGTLGGRERTLMGPEG